MRLRPFKLWLKDSERRPDPVPVATDDRKAVFVGTALWVVALIVALFVPVADGLKPYILTTCATGIALGLVGLAYTHRRHLRR